MSNLGTYQVMTTVAKRMGGPGYLLIACGGAGYCILRVAEAGGKKAVKAYKMHKETKEKEASPTYSIVVPYSDKFGLQLKAGDRVRIVETDGDSYLIDKLGDKNNPYFISGEKLKAIVSQG